MVTNNSAPATRSALPRSACHHPCNNRGVRAVAISPPWIRWLRLTFAVFGLVALTVGLLRNGSVQAGDLNLFTDQANLLGLLVLLVGALFDPRDRRWQLVRGAATLYLLIIGIVYAVLLSHIPVGDEQGWVDDVLQRIMPMVMIVDWVLAPVALGISGRLIAGWLVYPLGYGAYALIRGPIVDWYPYLFLDPRHQGYVSMATGLVVLVIGFALLAVAVAALGVLCGRRRGADEPGSDEVTWLSSRGG